ncbi:NAD(P)H-binding protein [Proteus terrae]|uniref:NAD(P)H-binding protein n=1 Tax=Proteus terrae subsp. cibarius TaxID=626774 RepID=A0A6G6SYH7_9GAMM|nr:NAD(P)H-binding protein [Proteus terrae]MBG2914556.1 NAD(P)H-binding protein [Proteus terrae subsp. cibarius]MCO4180586.1 NAD(P)H-binding protein [Proteus terrae]MCO4189574.1 NAD(P)H-binding protein [Proteus terrae]QGW03175.1 NAD(P)H-binding protein [Proteus terrae subsp. cibarius]QHD95594.1 NAD(P)H-binding protein [Proteus terrae subsp. cibarius]
MKTWVIFGAGGKGVGAHIADIGVTQQRPVVALVRSEEAANRLKEKGIKTIIGDAIDAKAVEAVLTLAGKEADIISTMGGENDYLAHRTVIDIAEKMDFQRMLMVSSLGCGDSWAALSDRAKAAFGQAVREKSLAEVWLQTSHFDYAIVRPGGLLNGEETGKAQLYQYEETHGLVNRRDVARLVTQLLEADLLGDQIYAVVEPGLAPSK